jgi:hypothetical protein
VPAAQSGLPEAARISALRNTLILHRFSHSNPAAARVLQMKLRRRWLLPHRNQLPRKRPFVCRAAGPSRSGEGDLPEAPPKGEREKRVDLPSPSFGRRSKKARRSEGRYLLRSNLTDTDPTKLREFYLRLSEVERRSRI